MTTFQAYDKGDQLEFYSAKLAFLPHNTCSEALKLNFTQQSPYSRSEARVTETQHFVRKQWGLQIGLFHIASIHHWHDRCLAKTFVFKLTSCFILAKTFPTQSIQKKIYIVKTKVMQKKLFFELQCGRSPVGHTCSFTQGEMTGWEGGWVPVFSTTVQSISNHRIIES